jgi:DNA-binding NarL/FixJ family response regulator
MPTSPDQPDRYPPPPNVRSGSTRPKARVLITSSEFLAREGLTSLLSHRNDLQLLPPVPVIDLASRLGENPPNVVVLLLAAGLRSAPQLVHVARMLREHPKQTSLVVVSQRGDGLVRVLLESGPHGVAFLMDEHIEDLETLIRAIKDVLSGVVVVDATVTALLVGREDHVGLSALTPRELDVLAELSRGLSNRSIGEALHITLKAVEGNCTNVFRKLQLQDDQEIDRRTTAALIFLNARS